MRPTAPSRHHLRALCVSTALLTLIGAAPGCSSSEEGNETKCKEDGAVDKRAVLALSDEIGPVKASYIIDTHSISGGEKALKFTLRNVANVLSAQTVAITSITLKETDSSGSGDGIQTFSCKGPDDRDCAKATFAPVAPEGWLAQAKCPPKGTKTSESFTIHYTHSPQAGIRHLDIAIHTSGDPDWNDKALKIKMDTRLGSPRLECAQSMVEFGVLKAGESKTETLKCFNTGTAPLTLSRVEVLSTTTPPLKVSFAEATATQSTPYEGNPAVLVPPSASLEFAFALTKVPNDTKIGATVKIHTDDPKTPVTSVMLQANSSGPCYTIHPNPIDFGTVSVGQNVAKELQLTSCGSEELPIVSIALGPSTGQDFSLDFSTSSFPAAQHKTGPTAAAPLKIVPGGATETLRVHCTPQQADDKLVKGEVIFTAADKQTKEVQLLCQPYASTKPLACVQIFVDGKELLPGETVIPQTPLVLKGGCSTAPVGQNIAKYQWQQPPQQPTGSVGLLHPSPLANPAYFTPNVAGKYTFCLSVYDNLGAKSELVCRELQVVPDNKLHIELVWTQAGDKEKNDKIGADLDLHLAHPLAPKVSSQNALTGAYSKQGDADGNGEPDPWFAQCYDCFWLNCKGASPNWPATGDTKDDPQVDLDDTDGWGPENLSIEVPQENEWYQIGVYAWDDAKMGPVMPTVRVFLDKKLVKEIKGPPMRSEDMWCVAQVLWNPSSPNPIADVVDCEGASPNKPLLTKNYPNPAKDPLAFNLSCPPAVGP